MPLLPRWKCHKEVNAAKIERIENTTDGAVLWLHGGFSRRVNLLWLDRHHPQVGGYFVEYADQYTSFSPAQAFEDGYTRMLPEPEPVGQAELRT